MNMPTPQIFQGPNGAVSGQSCNIILTPIVPEPQVNRYERIVHVQDNDEAFEVKKGPLDCSEELAVVAGWEPLTHPEGALFFYHPDNRVFTDADVRHPGTAEKIGKAVEKAYEEARNANIFLHSSVELALELIEKDGKEMIGYYFADHERRIIFWFQDHKSDLLMCNIRGVESKSHVTLLYLPRFTHHNIDRRHIELFPNKRSLPGNVVVQLKEIIMHAHAENITSETCLAPFAPDEVASMLSLVEVLINSDTKDNAHEQREHSVWIVARLMRLFCNAKFVNFCGQPGARLNVDQSLYGEFNTRSKRIFLRLMNIMLFGSPDAQSKALHRIWVDDTIVQPRWKNFIDRLTTEWNGYTIFSTVMLAVDISFLAVPSVQTQTSAILLAYLSTLCAMGSLLVSLILAGQVNDSRRSSAEAVASFMVGMSRSMLGLESLALMLSLPFALLIWGMMFFAAALSTLIFRTSGIVTISITSPVLAAIFMLVTWPVLASNDIHVSHLRNWIIEHVSLTDSSAVTAHSVV
ncbi:hypothetical protein DEU56DRAFT_982320 [Suillus clintonianus]|uniref:uncharacterized protein n=1 Tax=Suillus clintonianus TaxID=1904413 RepID=UPI001B8816E1|nr:uncharacterized protein DEU56DRAFT_982320 [Suillus clintonianus]KAG2129446.1 hypothetical protein DEU56DRAFT_982320 [Suillus clintonianus]